jgi:hypothetical protein
MSNVDCIAQRLINVRYWRNTGILLIGVVKPDNNENGMISRKENSIACCLVVATDDNSSPIAASKAFLYTSNSLCCATHVAVTPLSFFRVNFKNYLSPDLLVSPLSRSSYCFLSDINARRHSQPQLI